MNSYLPLYSPDYRAHVSLSWGFPPGLCFLSHPTTVSYAVDTSSVLRTTRGYSVPDFRLALDVGLHSSPGFSGVSPGRLHNRPALSLAFWPQP